MKNMRFFPFQRNSYFTGKLLTVRDFKAEQQYMNDKRRLLSRFLGGIGVVCGMTVTRLDGKQIIIDSGFALDGSGREIVIDSALIKNLSEIDGFENSGRVVSPHAYLCIEYAEEEKEPMHGIADNALAESKYNRIEEGFRLYLTHTEPVEPSSGAHMSTPHLESEFYGRISEPIYLAKIELIRWGAAYEIDKVVPFPFNQLVMSPNQLHVALDELQGRVNALISDIQGKKEPESPPHVKPDAETRLTSSGIVTVLIPKGVKSGQTFYSEEISHGLGKGNVVVTLGMRTKHRTVFGSPSVFRESADYDFAACVNREEGTFQAGVLLKNGGGGASITFDWMACREKEERPDGFDADPRVKVVPGTVAVKPGQTCVFKAETQGLINSDVKWSVTEKDGGVINNSGVYTAPDSEGVFTVWAKSAGNPEVSGSAYVVVRI